MKHDKFIAELADLIARATAKAREPDHLTFDQIGSQLRIAANKVNPPMPALRRPKPEHTFVVEIHSDEPFEGGEAFYVKLDDDLDGYTAEPVLAISPEIIQATLRKAAETFEGYRLHHLAKGTPESDKKAGTNASMVAMCLNALGEPSDTPIPAPRMPQESDSALPAPVEAEDERYSPVAAIRALIAEGFDEEHITLPTERGGFIFEAIDQLLDKMIVVTDADIPLYLRTLAGGAMRHRMPDTAKAMNAAAEQIEKGLHVGLEDPEKALREITASVGKWATDKGWWADANLDLRTCDYAPHVFAGKMMLVTSEVSEAMEGHRKSKPGAILMDDHLPDRPMVEVEFADAHIRLFDLGANYRLPGGGLLDVPGAIMEKMAYNHTRPDHDPVNRAKDGGKTI